MQARDPKIVQHQATFMVGDSLDHLRVHDDPESLRGCWKGMSRRPNSTTNEFSYGFSIIPCPSVLRTSMAQLTILKNFFFGQ